MSVERTRLISLRSMKTQTKRLTFLGIAVAIALVLSYIEMLLPPIWSAVPGIKAGLPNIVIILVLYGLSLKDAAAVSLVRLALVTLLFGNAMTLLYSLAGAVLSLGIMAILKKINSFSVVGVSIAGAVFHNLGQIIVAIIIMQTKEIGYYMIVLAFSGTIAGIFVGLLGGILLKYFKRLKL